MSKPFQKAAVMSALAVVLSLVAALYAFWPGLTGPFLFDDFPNLSTLGLFGGVHDWRSAVRFIFGGNAGPLGRPVSLASFLINDHTWPSEPYSFKYTNLLFHLLAGVALLSFYLQLLRAHHLSRGFSPFVAVFAMAIWLLHPMQAAPIFLTVQRMTLLCGIFVFAGLAFWVAGRNRLLDGRRHAYGFMTFGIVICGALAALSKENGALLPILALATEMTLAPLPRRRGPQVWRAVFLIAPTVLLLAYFVVNWHVIAGGYARREFSLAERLMTEPLILLSYLHEILLPQLTTTIFRDDFPVVHQIGVRATLVWGAWIAAFIAAVVLRRRYPLPCFAVLFFLAGHVLESGPIALELYYSHRNYVPMVGIEYALAVGLFWAFREKLYVAYTAAVVYAGLLVTITVHECRYWGDEGLLVNAWVDERPASARAAAMAGNFWGRRGHYAKAGAILDRMLALTPNSLSMQIGDYYMHCLMGQEDHKRWDTIWALLPTAPRDNAVTDAFAGLHRNLVDGTCKQVSDLDIIAALDRLKDNPRYGEPGVLGVIDYSIASYFLYRDDKEPAVGALEQAVALSPTIYAYEQLGDLLLEKGDFVGAGDAYQHALDIPFFTGWRGKLFPDKPGNDGIRRKLEAVRAQLQGSKPVSAGEGGAPAQKPNAS